MPITSITRTTRAQTICYRPFLSMSVFCLTASLSLFWVELEKSFTAGVFVVLEDLVMLAVFLGIATLVSRQPTARFTHVFWILVGCCAVTLIPRLLVMEHRDVLAIWYIVASIAVTTLLFLGIEGQYSIQELGRRRQRKHLLQDREASVQALREWEG